MQTNTMDWTQALPIRATLRRLALVAVSGLIASLASAQVPGSLDTTPFPGFASGNGVIPALPIGTGADRAYSVALQSDGKIVMAGGCATGIGTSMCFARLNADGALDNTFDGPGTTPGNGKFTFFIGSISNEVRAVAIQPDQKIVALGTCDNKFCLARLNPDGSFDPSFVGPDGNGAGRFRITIGALDDAAEGMALQTDGKLVVVGSCQATVSMNVYRRYCAARLNSDGSFDASFDGPVAGSPANGGFLFAAIGSDSNRDEVANAVTVQSDGRIVIAGTCYAVFSPNVCVLRLNTSGTFDTSFDGPSGSGNGKATIEISNLDEFPRAVLVQPDGKILIAAKRQGATYFVARLRENGSLDNEFGNGAAADALSGLGNVEVFFGVSGTALTSMALQPDGKILLGGTCAATNFCVARLHSDGTLDTAFDGNIASPADGALQLTFGVGVNQLTSMALQPDGKIVIAGYCSNGSNDDFCIARLNSGPSAARECSLDIDGDGQITATVDSLIHARLALGITGNAVIAGITFPANAKRNVWGGSGDNSIRKYLITQCGMSIP